MNVSIENLNEAEAVLTVNIKGEDYAEKVEKTLRDYRRRADIKGFRKGQAPLGMIKKMYGQAIKAEQINRTLNQAIGEYLQENKIAILGAPMECENEPALDFEKDEDFVFRFDLALEPQLAVELDKKDKLPFYHIEATEEMVNGQVEQMRSSMGTSSEAEVSVEGDVIYGHLVQLEGDAPMADGVEVEQAILLPQYIKDEEIRARFVGVHVGDAVVFEPYKAYQGSDVEIASFLHVDKSKAAEYEGKNFELKVSSIKHHEPAALDETFFKAAFGENTPINSEEAMRAEVKRSFEEQLKSESDYKFLVDMRAHLLEKVGEPKFAEKTLKRWLKSRDEKRTDEDVEREYPAMIKDLTYHLIHARLEERYEIKVNEEEIMQYAVLVAKNQFAQYGMNTVPNDMLEKYAKSMLEKEETRYNLSSRVAENKVAQAVRECVSLDEKTVSWDEFRTIMDGAEA